MKQRLIHRTATPTGTPRSLAVRLAAPAALVATFGFASLITVELVSAQDAQGETKQEAKADTSKPAQVGRGRLSGRQAPPKPAAVPKGSRATGAGASAKAPGSGQPKVLSAADQKARAEYEAKLAKQGAGANIKGRTGAAPRPPRNPNAKLEIPFGTDKHDFGRARQGDLLTHTFEMDSSGSEPVIISQASPTCGCTLGEIKVRQPGAEVAELYTFGDSIPPGSKVELAATLDTASKRNKTNVRINVYSNDGKTGVTMLSLAANVEPFLISTPQFLQLGDIREGTEKTGAIDFRTSSGEHVMLSQDATRPIPLPQGLAVNFEAINPGEDGRSNLWRASFTIAADSAEGGKSYAIRLNSDVELPTPPNPVTLAKAKAKGKGQGQVKPGAPTVYQVTANINYRILGALSLQPQYVSLGLVRPGQPVVRNVRLTCHEPDFDMSNVKATLVGEGEQQLNWADRFTVSVKPVSGSNAVDIELRLEGLPDEADGSFRGRVVIQTGHPAKPEDFFRFSGVCRKLAGTAARPLPVKRPGVSTKGPGKSDADKSDAGKSDAGKSDAGKSDAGK